MKKERSRLIGFCAAIIVGISVPYFLVNVGSEAYQMLASKWGIGDADKVKASLVATTTPPEHVRIDADTSDQYFFEGPDYKLPETSGLAYEVADVDTGEVIIEKNQDMVLPIASISKLVTALVAEDKLDLNKPVTVSRSSIQEYGNGGGLAAGEKILGNDLMYPLLMESSNDAADVFAEAYGFDAFVKLMNEKALAIGMASSTFDEPSGLSANNLSTASDLITLARYITKNYPELWAVTRVRGYSILHHSWLNNSVLSKRPNFVGGKIGFTYEANQTVVVVLNIPMSEGGTREIAISVLKSDDRESDVDALQRFLSKWVGFLPAGESLNEN